MGKENTKQKTGNAVLNALKKSNMTAMASLSSKVCKFF